MPRVAPWIALCLTAVTLAGCLEPPARPQGILDVDASAREFGVRVVGMLLASDYASFRAVLADQVYTLEGEGPYSKAEVDAFFANDPFPSRTNTTNYTLAEYNATYAPEVWTFARATQEYPEFANVSWSGWTPDAEDDRIFVGSKTKSGEPGWLWEDILSFAITRASGEWRYKAFSG